MKITVNGSIKEIEKDSSITSMLSEMKLIPEAIVVEINGNIVSQNKYSSVLLRENDVIELVHFVGGG